MISRSELILGPPGCGKTHTLIEIVREALTRGVDLDRIGYVSFTKKAVNEAVERAGSAFNLTPDDLPSVHYTRLDTTVLACLNPT